MIFKRFVGWVARSTGVASPSGDNPTKTYRYPRNVGFHSSTQPTPYHHAFIAPFLRGLGDSHQPQVLKTAFHLSIS
jgi:hypothetical protein